MKEGTVVESGTHQYLRKNGPEYIRLNQIIEKEEEEEVEKSRRKSSANGDGLKEIEINFEAKAEDEKNPNKSKKYSSFFHIVISKPNLLTILIY